jgi:large subunit ribosomal protein L9
VDGVPYKRHKSNFGKDRARVVMPQAKTKSQRKIKRRTGTRHKRWPIGPNGGVELLLIQSVEHLGSQGDVVEVKRGYATNFLIPQGLATIATDHHKRMVDKHKAKLQEIEKTRLKKLRDEANEIAKQSVTIEANANDEGHLYGSVGAAEIVAALKQQDVQLAQDQIRLEGPLKELGLYTVKIQLHSAVDAELKVWVVPTVGSAADTDGSDATSAEEATAS